jgi:hypothetical protein
MDKVQKHNSFNTNTPSSESYRNHSDVKLNGLAHPSQRHLLWQPVSQLLTAVKCVTKLTVVILNTYTTYAN